ncbi:MAG: hypothetical protein ACOCWM_02425 [Cyclobacteriaceae bacterium]
MLKPLLRLLNVEKGEEKPVLLLLAMGFFMGVFLYTYKIVSEALFLSTYNEDHVPAALFISALLGVISTSIFATLQNKMSFARLAIFNYLVIFCFLGLIRLSFAFLPDSVHNILIFGLFILFQPVLSITILGFWGLFGRIFNLRQSKRIIGGIDSGQLTAAILISFTITLINQYIENYDILIISMGGILVSMIFLIILIKNTNIDQKVAEEDHKVNTNLKKILKDKYVVLLSSFLFLSMLSYMIIHFSFLTATDIYFTSEQQLVSFLGVFHGSIMILSLLMQTFVNDKLIAMYGLRTALMVLPVVLFLLTLAVIVVASTVGVIPGTPEFTWFFLFVAISKLFMDSLKEALENPSFKLFFMPLDIRIRFDIQAKVEGVVNESSRFIASIIILILGFLTFFKIIHFSYLLAAVIIAWLLVTNKLYQEYRQNVKKKLQGHNNEDEYKQKKITYIRNTLSQIIKSTSSEKILFSLRLMERFDPNIIRSVQNELLASDNNQVRKFSLDRMQKHKHENKKGNIELQINGKVDGIEKLLKGGFALHDKNYRSQLRDLINSEDINNRLYAINAIKNELSHDNAYLLLEFFSDNNMNIRKMALQLAEQVPNPEFYPILLQNSLLPEYNESATQTMANIGEIMFPFLESAFYKTRQDSKIMLKVIQVYGMVGGKHATELLWNKIDYPDKKIMAQVLVALGKCGFMAKNDQVTRIKLAIQSDIANFTWNLAALEVVDSHKNTKALYNAIKEDNDHIINHIFMLLSMIYDPHSIQLVKENLESNTSEGTAYALELIDVFLSDDIKEQITFLLDDMGNSDKLNKLQNHYPQSDLTFYETLKHLVNRDFNQISRYAKACTYMHIGKNQVKNFNLILIANLFNSDWLIKECAAWTLYQTDPQAYHDNLLRLPHNEQTALNNCIVAAENNNKLIRFQKIEALKKVGLFEIMPGTHIANLVDHIFDFNLHKGESLDISHDIHHNFYIVNKGIFNLLINQDFQRQYEEGDILMEYFKINAEDELFIKTDNGCQVLKVSKNFLYDFLADHYDLSLKIVEYFRKDVQSEEIL